MKKKKKIKRIFNDIKKGIKEFFTYDRVYYNGKLSSLCAVIISFLIIVIIIIYTIIFK